MNEFEIQLIVDGLLALIVVAVLDSHTGYSFSDMSGHIQVSIKPVPPIGDTDE